MHEEPGQEGVKAEFTSGASQRLTRLERLFGVELRGEAHELARKEWLKRGGSDEQAKPQPVIGEEHVQRAFDKLVRQTQPGARLVCCQAARALGGAAFLGGWTLFLAPGLAVLAVSVLLAGAFAVVLSYVFDPRR